MSWCSGTEIFDVVCEEIIENDLIPDHLKKRILLALVRVMEDHDWDCQHDSNYFDHPTVKEVLYELHPSWKDD